MWEEFEVALVVKKYLWQQNFLKRNVSFLGVIAFYAALYDF